MLTRHLLTRRPATLPVPTARPHRATLAAERTGRTTRRWLGLGVVALLALALRVLLIGDQSAFMDESTFILTGRLWLAEGRVYANILTWACGFYPWFLLAGAADMLGGLALVRGVTAVLGAVTAVATAVFTVRLLGADARTRPLRRTAGLIAGGLVAVLPTTIALGRFGTYDALAGAAFALALAVLVPAPRAGETMRLLGGAALVALAVLAKYVVAIYVPVLVLYLLLAARERGGARRVLLAFIAPLALAGAAYGLLLLPQLRTLLNYLLGFGDLAAADPLRVYVVNRPELWLLAALALFGARRASAPARWLGFGGAGVTLVFQALTRADADFWKHALYFVISLAPLAALGLTLPGRRLGTWRPARPAALAAAVAGGAAASLALALSLASAHAIATNYPNLAPAVRAVQAQAAAAGARRVLTDDSALAYYLYPALEPEQITDPYYINYQGAEGDAGYRQALADRAFDLIVFDGGVGPRGQRFRADWLTAISAGYRPVYRATLPDGTRAEIYRRDDAADGPSRDAATTARFTFETGFEGWGGHPQAGSVEPGLGVDLAPAPGRPGTNSLRFTAAEDRTLVGVRSGGPVARITATVYLAPGPADSEPASAPVPVGMVGFDSAWGWHDDGFGQLVTPGQWTTLTWELPEPDAYQEIGLALPPGAGRQLYLADVTVEP